MPDITVSLTQGAYDMLANHLLASKKLSEDRTLWIPLGMTPEEWVTNTVKREMEPIVMVSELASVKAVKDSIEAFKRDAIDNMIIEKVAK